MHFGGSSSPSRVSMPVIIAHLVAMSIVHPAVEQRETMLSLWTSTTDGSIVW